METSSSEITATLAKILPCSLVETMAAVISDIVKEVGQTWEIQKKCYCTLVVFFMPISVGNVYYSQDTATTSNLSIERWRSEGWERREVYPNRPCAGPPWTAGFTKRTGRLVLYISCMMLHMRYQELCDFIPCRLCRQLIIKGSLEELPWYEKWSRSC